MSERGGIDDFRSFGEGRGGKGGRFVVVWRRCWVGHFCVVVVVRFVARR